MNNDVMEGAAELAFRDAVIPSWALSEVSVTITEGTRERSTLAGTFTTPSGSLDEAMAEVTLFPPSWDWLGENLIRAHYTPGTGSNKGSIVWNAQTCSGEVDLGPMNIHFVCDDTDDNDVFFYNARLLVSLNPTFNEDDAISVQLTFHAQPDEDGNVFRLGTGDVTQESVWNPETETTVPAES